MTEPVSPGIAGPARRAAETGPAAPPPLALRVDNVHFAYPGSLPVLAGLSLDVPAGGFLGIVGPNGAGKSTLLHLMTGALRPGRGGVELFGRPLPAWKRREIAGKIAVVPQSEPWSFPFRVMEIVLMGRTPHLRGLLATETDADREAAWRALEATGIAGLADRTLDRLSGGERQLVLVARALAQDPDILLLDEPTASLDLAHQQQVFRLLVRLNRERGLTVAAVTHDLNLAALYCDDMAVLHEGRIVVRGAPAEILQDALLSRVYRAGLWTGTSPAGTPIVGLTR
jgi:iron complex transport system ATP-binding protein